MGPDYGKHVYQFYMFLASKICMFFEAWSSFSWKIKQLSGFNFYDVPKGPTH